MATDPRWVHAQPPRTEPELAWVQHRISALAPGGVGVVLLSPAVAARRAGRRAGTHASTTSRIDVRRLRVPRFSLEQQHQYGGIYRRIAAFESDLSGLYRTGSELVRTLGDMLAHGRLPRD